MRFPLTTCQAFQGVALSASVTQVPSGVTCHARRSVDQFGLRFGGRRPKQPFVFAVGTKVTILEINRCHTARKFLNFLERCFAVIRMNKLDKRLGQQILFRKSKHSFKRWIDVQKEAFGRSNAKQVHRQHVQAFQGRSCRQDWQSWTLGYPRNEVHGGIFNYTNDIPIIGMAVFDIVDCTTRGGSDNLRAMIQYGQFAAKARKKFPQRGSLSAFPPPNSPVGFGKICAERRLERFSGNPLSKPAWKSRSCEPACELFYRQPV